MALHSLHSYIFWRNSTILRQYSPSLKPFIVKLITSMTSSLLVHCTSHCATSRQVAGSIPDGVIAIFHSHNPSGHSVALGSNQPLTEMSTRDISWGGGGKGGRCLRLTTLPPSCADCLEIWEPQPPGILRVKISRSAMGLIYHLHFMLILILCGNHMWVF